MKNLKLLLFVVISIVLFNGCKKDNDQPYKCETCVQSPEANAAHNNSSKGIYKGVVIGSTGTIKFNIANDGSTIHAELVMDGIPATLTSSIAWTANQWYIAPFTGVLKNQPVSVTFAVNPSGDSATVMSSDIPNHPNATFALVKETSNALIEGFEGYYTTSANESGRFNILLSRKLKKWGGIARDNGSTDTEDVKGTIDTNNNLVDDNGTTVGSLAGDVITGTFTDNNNITITLEGERTL